MDHAILGDDRGFIDVIDRQGNRKGLTREFSTVQGLAWPPNGNEIWFTAGVNTEPSSLRAVDLHGKERMLLSSPVRLHLQDISKDQNVLLTVEDYRDQQVLSDIATGKIRDVSSFPFQITEALSRDGRMLLLNTYVTGANSDYNLYTQRTDGSSPAMIGQGAGLGLSFDGKWAVALNPLNLQQLRIIPTGVGEARTLNAPPGLKYIGATWMPDGKHVLVVAAAPGHAPATYLQEVATGTVRQVTSEGKYLATSDQEFSECLARRQVLHHHRWRKPLLGAAHRGRRATRNQGTLGRRPASGLA